MSTLSHLDQLVGQHRHHFTSTVLDLNLPCACMAFTVDPRILYEGLVVDYTQDEDLLAHLDKAKSALHTLYHDNYSGFTFSADRSDMLVTAPIVQNGSPQKVDFTARYK